MENLHKLAMIPSILTLTPSIVAHANTKEPISSKSLTWLTVDTKSAATYTQLQTSTCPISFKKPR